MGAERQLREIRSVRRRSHCSSTSQSSSGCGRRRGGGDNAPVEGRVRSQYRLVVVDWTTRPSQRNILQQ
eukprot:scaffold451543_cov197-Attheya_sp.AAC.1